MDVKYYPMQGLVVGSPAGLSSRADLMPGRGLQIPVGSLENEEEKVHPVGGLNWI